MTNVPACLQCEVCPNCGYSLKGQMDPKQCPECGRDVNPSEIVLHGWARGSRENIATARKSRLIWVAILSAAWILLQFAQFFLSLWFTHKVHWFLIILAPAMLIFLFLFFARQDVQHPGLIQVRMNSRECVQFGFLSGPPMVVELFRCHGWILLVLCMIAMVVAHYYGAMDSIMFWMFIWPVIGFAIWLWFDCVRVRRALANQPDNAMADRNTALNRPAPWKRVTDIKLSRLAPDRYRMWIEAKTWVATRYPVDAEIACSDEQANVLRQWLSDRITGNRNAEIRTD